MSLPDAIEVAPDLHKIIFENDKFRVLDVTVKPGDKAKMHWHPDNVGYVLAGGELTFIKPDGKRNDVTLAIGQVTSGSGEHAVENNGQATVHVIQVELKKI